jgi:fatty acid desaturase
MSDDSTEQDLADVQAARTRLPALEWQTLLLLVVAYGGWLVVTRAYGRWPLYLVAPLAVVLMTLHSSLQHEILHGHPTRWALNHLHCSGLKDRVYGPESMARLCARAALESVPS